ncbi:MAG TPA: N-acetylmuramoyl-L-alanine amidase [Acidimicrobiales bacterium]|nr:N-acetylmuramoyl-L-alanine amidase [Acidimicrobiales bacterium]
MRIRLLVAVVVGAVASVVPVPMAWSAPRTRLVVLDASGGAQGAGVEFAASHLGLRWSGTHEARVQVRWEVGGRWSHWEDAPVAHDMDDDERGIVYSGLLRVPGASRVQTRVLEGPARHVEVAAIDAEHGPRHLVRAAPPAAAGAPGDPPGTPPQPAVVTRAQWGADESLRKDTPLFAPVTKLIVHHTATDNLDADPAATIRAIYAFHTQVRGWEDIGYNFLVDASGRVYEGRWARQYGVGEVPTGEDLQRNGVVGAHAEGTNTGSAGIALLGDFTSTGPTQAAMAGLESWLAWKAARHEIDPVGSDLYKAVDGTTSRFPNISGHRDVRATDCPGDQLYAALPALRLRVAAARTAVRVPRGYWIVGASGAVHAIGAAPFLGDAGAIRLTSPIRGMASTPAQRGYWLLGGDGGIFAFGDAAFRGSTGAMRLNKPVVGMAATPTGGGYWLVASDGGIFAFGDAGFFGSTGAMRLNKPVVGMAPTASGKGYWLVASDGGIFAFGDARFAGSTGSIALNSPISAMEPADDGRGYWLVARDGGVFAFGVPFHGSIPGLGLPSYAGSESLRSTPAGLGYYVLGADGGIFTFGQAPFFGATPGLSGAAAAVDMVVYDVPVALG